MPRRRSRELSEEDRALWRRIAASANPLGGRASVPPPPEPGPPPTPAVARAPAASGSADMPRRPDSGPPIAVDLVPDPGAALARGLVVMDRRRLEKLRRGRIEPEARIDLHGLSSAGAHAALTGFLLAEAGRGTRLVLVITGKGRATDPDELTGRPGILRHNVPHWLAAPPLRGLVLQIVPAHRRHGGGGAYYVYLRRRR